MLIWEAGLKDPAYMRIGRIVPMNKGFDKVTFKRSVIDNVKNMFRRTIDEATPQQVFQAVSYAVKDVIIDEWIATHKEYEKKDTKTVYYLSMEFLMGRALGNNIINICAHDEIKEVLDELGFDLNLTSGSMFPGFPCNPGISCLRLRHPLPLRYV